MIRILKWDMTNVTVRASRPFFSLHRQTEFRSNTQRQRLISVFSAASSICENQNAQVKYALTQHRLISVLFAAGTSSICEKQNNFRYASAQADRCLTSRLSLFSIQKTCVAMRKAKVQIKIRIGTYLSRSLPCEKNSYCF